MGFEPKRGRNQQLSDDVTPRNSLFTTLQNFKASDVLGLEKKLNK
jgi:hypothetical protein